jgi:predicted MPP superfamily phosphohydrolase
MAATAYTIFIERYLVQFNTYRLPVPHLPREFNGLRIVHLSDIHYGTLVPYSFVRGLIEKVQKLEKDIVICTGDYIHERNSTSQIDKVWPLLGELEAPEGVYAVLGNHDHWGSTERSLYWLNKSGHGVRGKAVPVERGGQRIWIAGAGDLWEDDIGIDTLLKGVPESECRIVLAHNPDSADSSYEERVDLMLSGHTHGGQVNIPLFGPPILPVKNKKYSSGLVRTTKNQALFISRGIGWAIYPVRFNCFPEIPILELISAS